MLVLTRRPGQALVVNGPATIRVLKRQGRTIHLAIEAEKTTTVVREELLTHRDLTDQNNAEFRRLK